jgi:hypothetical protein
MEFQGKISEKEATEFVKKYYKDMSVRDVTNLVHGMAKKRIRLNTNIMLVLVDILQRRQITKADHIYVAKWFQGIKLFKLDDPDHHPVLERYLAYLEEVMEIKRNSMNFTGQSIGQCMYALQRLSGEQEGVNSLLKSLTIKILLTNYLRILQLELSKRGRVRK